MVNAITAGPVTYIPKFSAMTEIPNPNTEDSEPSSANVIIDRVESIGVMNSLIASRSVGFSRSMSAIAGENE